MNELESKLCAASMLHAIIHDKVDWEKVNSPGILITAMEFYEDLEWNTTKDDLIDRYKTPEDCADLLHRYKQDEIELLINIHNYTYFAWSNEGEHDNQIKIDYDNEEE